MSRQSISVLCLVACGLPENLAVSVDGTPPLIWGSGGWASPPGETASNAFRHARRPRRWGQPLLASRLYKQGCK